jgi:ribokinase
MRFDIICFGALNVDRLYRVNRIAREDEESYITDFEEVPGGSAANTAVGLARLGLKIGFMGKVSDDREGNLLVEDFQKEGVDTNGIVVLRGDRSGVVVGFVDREGERALYVDPGVNDFLQFEDIDLKYAQNTEFFHLTSFVGETPLRAQKNLIRILSGVRVSFDPGELYTRRGLASLQPMIKRSTVLFLNRNEMKVLTGEGYEKGSKILIEKGASIVTVKLGKKGCYVTDGKENHLVGPYKVEVVDTTGAGDAFCAGFLYGLMKNKDLHECGRLANFVASRSITKVGARDGLPKVSDLCDLK